MKLSFLTDGQPQTVVTDTITIHLNDGRILEIEEAPAGHFSNGIMLQVPVDPTNDCHESLLLHPGATNLVVIEVREDKSRD
ncbi:hypothetical protein EOK75_06810 [Pseudorhodobacter turbinis]|uniref:Uncharacterized protein n=1 Tax=Pseudorhodobacter turbinis TaxID=2500533 RepID=A0A4P8EEM3_9RHOB|nr:hypothetical protein [Pseudorhodobacter turbinis]QCO55490.1 hypothetical protein EOK75_06810 [Pseudorhodobacter turbinis]